jgi:hypothetical protein
MPGQTYDPAFESQDQAETFDESNTAGGEGDVPLAGDSPLDIGEDMRTFEELPEVEDVTRAEGDADDDEAIALDADEFDPDAIQDRDFEEDDELDYHASDAEHEDDIDGLGPELGSEPLRRGRSEISGLDEVRDAGEAQGGEDDFSNFEADALDEDDLQNLGYAKGPPGGSDRNRR